MRQINKYFLILMILGAAGVLLMAACGGTPTPPPIPTMTPIPIYQFEQPTEAPQVAQAAATLANTGKQEGLDPEAVERGRGRYEALECGECHGENGEGTDKGSSLIASTQSEDEFISFMRSGGDLGSDHQYSTNRLSESGGKNLYQYLLSLRGAS